VKGIEILPDEQIDYDLVKEVLAGSEFQTLSAGLKNK
jgi:D-glycero-D-manno-heptose 1,7-bisphosphate phosphatase